MRASIRPSPWSIRSASRSGVRLTPSSSASATCDIVSPGGSSPLRIASRTRRYTYSALWRAGTPLPSSDAGSPIRSAGLLSCPPDLMPCLSMLPRVATRPALRAPGVSACSQLSSLHTVHPDFAIAASELHTVLHSVFSAADGGPGRAGRFQEKDQTDEARHLRRRQGGAGRWRLGGRARRADDAGVLRARQRRGRDRRDTTARRRDAARPDHPEEVLPHRRKLPRAPRGIDAGEL